MIYNFSQVSLYRNSRDTARTIRPCGHARHLSLCRDLRTTQLQLSGPTQWIDCHRHQRTRYLYRHALDKHIDELNQKILSVRATIIPWRKAKGRHRSLCLPIWGWREADHHGLLQVRSAFFIRTERSKNVSKRKNRN